MNFSQQLKKYRIQNNYSQDELAEKIYVTRQTISKWENDRTYPDIHNLIALSVLFDVTLDELVKGDLETMKKNINTKTLSIMSWIMAIFSLLTALSVGPALKLWGLNGLIVPLILWIVAMIAAIKIETIKKKNDIKTYAEITAYLEGKDIASERQKRDKIKDFWHKFGIVLIYGLIAGVTALISLVVLFF